MRLTTVTLLIFSSWSLLRSQPDGEWLTYFELSGGRKTPRYAETIEFCKKLDAASPLVHYTAFGRSPQGRDLPVLILSKDRAFDPASAARAGKAIVLIQSGIHAGEIDGKDASLMLIRDISILKRHATMLDSTILLVIPIFNVDGHERFGAFNRINQNGPEEMGWRTTAQNLNLNRDYVKADAPEMRALLGLFSAWLPDFYIDCHVTDGIDFQYDVTYAMETAGNIEPALSEWIKGEFLPNVLQKEKAGGQKIFNYVFPREDNDLSKGLISGAAPPRFSTGYAAIQNRPAFLIETHMLKPYETRVRATYHLLKAIIETISESPHKLRSAVRLADEATIRVGRDHQSRNFLPVRFGIGERAGMRQFLGVRWRTESSEVSGADRRVYSDDPVELTVPFFDEVTVVDSVEVPLAYLVPQEWSFVPDVMKSHGIVMERLTEAVAMEVESYRFSAVKWRDRSFEGRHGPTYEVESIRGRRTYPAGAILIRTAQRAAKVAMHLLEPKSPDSFVAWGFFNSIFEQKEYAEPYVMEEIARNMLIDNPFLKREFENKVKSDTAFARSPGARLNWLYLRSAWADPLLNTYPVARVVTPGELKSRVLD